MQFNNLNFIFIFLPAFLLSYFLVDNKFKNIVILIYSILFYVIGNINSPINIFVLFVLTVVNYLFVYLIGLYGEKIVIRRFLLIISILYNVVILVIFKLGIFNIAIPVGLSFYVFHYITLIVDTRDNVRPISYLNYIFFFPKLMSGPIDKYYNFAYDYQFKSINLKNIYDGFCTFCIGLGLKTLLADSISYIINQINVFGFESISILTAWVGVYSYTMKLYFDFAGYSLMAIGLARIIGFSLPDNFDEPFSSKSMSEFWRRWHITLGRFFRDYVYIPLGGNFDNSNIIGTVINLIIVWVLTGLWHGITYNFVIWAMSLCVIIILEKLFLKRIYKKISLLGRLVVILFVPLTFLIFSLDNMNDVYIYFGRLIDLNSVSHITDFNVIINQYLWIFVVGIIFLTKLPMYLINKLKKIWPIMLIFSIVILILSCYMIERGTTDTFKYFAF